MLPAYIIDDLLKRDREKRQSDEVFIECPEQFDPTEPTPPSESDEPEERGVVIIDFTI